MFNRLSKFAVASGTAAMLSTGALATAPKAASAQSQGTINTILGAAALIGGVILYNNYVHKKQQANTVVGYTSNGGTVYGDGRVVMPNGATVYPNQNGQYPWGQYAYYSPNANPNQYQYDYNRSGQYDRTHRHWNREAGRHDNGLHRGWYKHDRDHDGD
jgi:hypothetical protein